MVLMFVNQFVTSIFGTMLAMAATGARNTPLTIFLSIVAVIFYMFLMYEMTWKIGAKDRISVDMGKMQYRPHTGVLLSLCANIPNFVVALLYSVAFPFMAEKTWAGSLAAIMRVVSILTEGMYLGLMTAIRISEQQLAYFWWTYFVITIPAMLTCWIAYYLGYRNIKFTTLFDYKDPTKPKHKD